MKTNHADPQLPPKPSASQVLKENTTHFTPQSLCTGLWEFCCSVAPERRIKSDEWPQVMSLESASAQETSPLRDCPSWIEGDAKSMKMNCFLKLKSKNRSCFKNVTRLQDIWAASIIHHAGRLLSGLLYVSKHNVIIDIVAGLSGYNISAYACYTQIICFRLHL